MNDEATNLAKTIVRFLKGSASPYEWDDCLSTSGLDEVKAFCWDVAYFMPSQDGRYCSAEGEAVLAKLAELLPSSIEAVEIFVRDWYKKWGKPEGGCGIVSGNDP